jgi:sirohydrochlorin ferrochelatase
MPWIETMRELDHDNVPFVPWIFRPIFFNTLRSEYLEAGGSAHNKLHTMFLDNLRRAMPEEEANGTKFYLAFLDSDPRPDEMTINAINDGASKIIILPVFITESTHTAAGQEMVASVQPEKYNIQVIYTGALWNSESLQNVFVERANEMISGLEKSKVGILLVGHGQPTEWEKIYPAQNQQENQYREAIRGKLIADGFSPENVALGWMEFQKPTITESVKELSGRGVEKILVFSVSLSADSIHSDIEVPAAIKEAKLPTDVTISYVGQYGDHPLAIKAMIEKISSCK